jgi:hypothetical protein
MKQFLIEFEHESNHLGHDGFGMLLVSASTFEEACSKIEKFSVTLTNSATGYQWDEYFTNPSGFINLTIGKGK